jgi:hypothetical protein
MRGLESLVAQGIKKVRYRLCVDVIPFMRMRDRLWT